MDSKKGNSRMVGLLITFAIVIFILLLKNFTTAATLQQALQPIVRPY
jgi:hypothetical protein